MFAKLKVSPLYKFSSNCLFTKKASTTNQIVGLLLADGFCTFLFLSFSIFQLSVVSTKGSHKVTKMVVDKLGCRCFGETSKFRNLSAQVLALNASESQKNVPYCESYFARLAHSVEETIGMG